MDKKDFSGKIGFGKTNLYVIVFDDQSIRDTFTIWDSLCKVINVIFFIQINGDSKTGINVVSVFIRKTFQCPLVLLYIPPGENPDL